MSRRIFVESKASAVPLWHVIDASQHINGRLASRISLLLQGKNKPIYNRSVLCGDHVVVLNAKNINLSANKWERTVYKWHTGYPGGLKQETAAKTKEEHPERILRRAVMGMLPKNLLRMEYMKRLHVFAGNEHPYQKQLLTYSPLQPQIYPTVPEFNVPQIPKEVFRPIEIRVSGNSCEIHDASGGAPKVKPPKIKTKNRIQKLRLGQQREKDLETQIRSILNVDSSNNNKEQVKTK